MPKTSPTTYDKAEEAHRSSSEISFRFGEKDKLQPTGFSNLSPEKEVMIIIKGATSSFSAGDGWDKSRRLVVDPTSIEILSVSDTEPVTLDSALKSASSSRRKFHR